MLYVKLFIFLVFFSIFFKYQTRLEPDGACLENGGISDFFIRMLFITLKVNHIRWGKQYWQIHHIIVPPLLLRPPKTLRKGTHRTKLSMVSFKAWNWCSTKPPINLENENTCANTFIKEWETRPKRKFGVKYCKNNIRSFKQNSHTNP